VSANLHVVGLDGCVSRVATRGYVCNLTSAECVVYCRRPIRGAAIEKETTMLEAKLVGGKLVLTVTADTDPQPSKSGKSNVVASTHGFVATSIIIKGKPVRISLNCII
jgi:hypothetical protein